jgi:hypothetical protein
MVCASASSTPGCRCGAPSPPPFRRQDQLAKAEVLEHDRHGAARRQMDAEAIEHLNNLGCMPFGQQIDLQVEMIPAIGDDAHSVLLHQYEARDQNRIE